MKKAFEKFRKAQQYIKEKNYSALKDMLNDITEINNSPRFGYGYHYNDIESFENITDQMILSELNHVVFTEPNFFDNEEFTKLCCRAENSMNYIGWHDPSIYFDCFTMSAVNKEQRIAVIRTLLKKSKLSCTVSDFTPKFMEKVVWYAVLENDDALIEEIYNIAENGPELLDGYEFHAWTWMYLEAIIEKKRYDLLDKTISLIYGKDNLDFINSCNFCRSDMSYTEFICFLYKRYCPEMSESQIAEQLINSMQYSNIMRQFPLNSNAGRELDCLMKLNMRTNVVNCILAIWLLSGCTLKKDYLYSLLEDKPVLYLNDTWVDMFVSHNSINSDKYSFLTDLLKEIPDITLSIDNHNNMCSCSCNINSVQLEKIFSICKPVMTDKVSDNEFIQQMIGSKSKKLKPLLKALELDDEARDELVELCVKNKNVFALDILNNNTKKEIR